MGKFNKMPLTNIKFILFLYDHPGISMILAGPAALKPTKGLYNSGYLQPKGKVKNPFKYGTHWVLNRKALTKQDIKEMREIINNAVLKKVKERKKLGIATS